MTAEIVKEVRFRRARAGKKFADGEIKGLLVFIARLWAAGAGLRRELERDGAQGVEINLARRESRQRGHHLKMRRHHVGGKTRRQGRAQFDRFEAGIRGGHDEADHLIHLSQRTHDDRRRRHARLGGERGRDFIQFHPEAANFHLVVGAPEAMHRSAGFEARQIPGEIHPRFIGTRGEGIGNETFRRQIRPAEIAQAPVRDRKCTIRRFRRRATDAALRQPPTIHNSAAAGRWSRVCPAAIPPDWPTRMFRSGRKC